MVDRNGLDTKPKLLDGGHDTAVDLPSSVDKQDVPATQDGRDATTTADRSVTPDVPTTTPDAQDSRPVEVGPTCDPSAGVHLCGAVCVSNQSVNNCGASCSACPIPANGTSTCDGTACGISCNTGFTPQGALCVPANCIATCDQGATAVTTPGRRFTGTTSGLSTSAGSCGGGSAPEDVFRLVLTATSDIFVTTHGTGFDTVVYMRRGCCGTELGCNDNADGRKTSVLSLTAVPAGTYEIFVDGAAPGAAGPFTVDIFATPTSPHPGDNCGHPIHISTAPVAGTTCGSPAAPTTPYGDDLAPQNCLDMNEGGLDVVMYFVLDAPTDVAFNTCNGTCIDSVLYTREVCTQQGTQGICDDDACRAAEDCFPDQNQSRISDTLDAGVHYLILDTYPNPGTCGAFNVTPSGIPP
jgi:hypothetical protein